MGESVSDVGVYATTATNNAIRAIFRENTEEPQVLIEADNTLPEAFARLRMMQTNTQASWDIAVGGLGNIMNFDPQFNQTVLTLFANGDAKLRGNLEQNSSRALKEQIHDLACEEPIEARLVHHGINERLRADVCHKAASETGRKKV